MRIELPSEWGSLRLDAVADVRLSNVDKKSDAGETPVRLCNYVDVYSHDSIISRLDLMAATATAAEIAKFQLRVGDVLITKDSEDPTDIAVPAVVGESLDPSSEPVLCGYHLALLRPTAVEGEYLAWALRSWGVNNHFVQRAQGTTRFGVTSEVIREAPVPVPPPAERRTIAEVLGSTSNARLAADAVVQQAHRVKMALLQDLLSRGIGHTRFRRTEIGSLPEEWELVRVGDLYTERKEPGEEGLPVMSVTIDNGLVLRDSLDRRVQSDLAPEDHARVRPGDLVYNTMRMWQGASGVATADGMVSPAYVVAAPNKRILPEFARALFKAPQTIRFLAAYSQGITKDRLRLYFDSFQRIPIPLPCLAEQRQIASALSSVAQFESDANLAGVSESLRRGLIEDLISGKVRVSV